MKDQQEETTTSQGIALCLLPAADNAGGEMMKHGDEDAASETEELDEDEWRDSFKDMLDSVEKKGDFCVATDVTSSIPRFQPCITVDGFNGGEEIAFPLPSSQAAVLREVAEKAPFGKGLNTVVDESVRKAFQIDARKVKFRNPEHWEATLQGIVSDAAASLGMSGNQKESVRANLYKMLLYDSGGFFKRHRDTEKEPGMFGTLIIQLPSKFAGGSLVIEHSGEKITFDHSAKSREGFFATAFYADCEHELLPVESGWRLCLAYNLVIPQSIAVSSPLPTASALTSQLHEVQKLTSRWNSLFDQPLGYLLEHDYTETNLKFSNLKGRDKEVVEFLRASRGRDGNPLYVVCLMLLEKHESGQPEMGYGYGYRRGYGSDSDGGDHTMGEVYNTEVGVNLWIGPDGTKMNGFNLNFDIDSQLISGEGEEEVFGEDPSRQDYESYTGNAGPTLDYWYYKATVVFWPRSMNMEVLKSVGDSYLVSYLNVAPASEVAELSSHILKLLEAKKLQMSASILSGLSKAGDGALIMRALKCCEMISCTQFASVLADVMCRFQSTEIRSRVIQIVKNTANAKKQHSYSRESLPLAIDFLDAIKSRHSALAEVIREAVTLGAASNIEDAAKSSRIDAICKHAFESSAAAFGFFCTAAKSNANCLRPILTSLISVGSGATTHPLVIELASLRARVLADQTRSGPPAFSWKMPNAVFAGSQGQSVTSFLRGDSRSETFDGFNGIAHARNWASKYFSDCVVRGSYSATAEPDGRGKGAYVTVTKNRAYHDAMITQYNQRRSEMMELVKKFGGELNASVPQESGEGGSDVPDDDQERSDAPFSWRQPNADFPGSNAEQVNAFLHGEEESHTFYHFHDLNHAQNWAYKYFGGHGQGTGYSARATAGRNSSGPYVTVTKTAMNSESDSESDFESDSESGYTAQKRARYEW